MNKQKYYIKETNLGTDILTKNILNGTRAFCLLKEKIEYAILDNNLIDDKIYNYIIQILNDIFNYYLYGSKEIPIINEN